MLLINQSIKSLFARNWAGDDIITRKFFNCRHLQSQHKHTLEEDEEEKEGRKEKEVVIIVL